MQSCRVSALAGYLPRHESKLHPSQRGGTLPVGYVSGEYQANELTDVLHRTH